jgi:hypothetical protein
MTTAPAVGIPVAAVLLARRVRVLVAATLVHTTVLAALGWFAGAGVTLPGVAGFAAHVAVSLGAALPVWWQFAGDPVSRQRRAVRAMTVSCTVLAVYSLLSAVQDALGRPLSGEPVVGAMLGIAAAVALPVLVGIEARAARGLGDAVSAAAAAPAVSTQAVLVGVLVAGVVTDLVAGTTLSGPTVSVVVGVLAAREAIGAARWGHRRDGTAGAGG